MEELRQAVNQELADEKKHQKTFTQPVSRQMSKSSFGNKTSEQQPSIMPSKQVLNIISSKDKGPNPKNQIIKEELSVQ